MSYGKNIYIYIKINMCVCACRYEYNRSKLCKTNMHSYINKTYKCQPFVFRITVDILCSEHLKWIPTKIMHSDDPAKVTPSNSY